MTLRYSEEVPTVPGWYWRRSRGHQKIIELPFCGVWPRPWQEIRDEGYAAAPEDIKEKLMQLPDENWKIEYAGPIQEPEGE